MRSALVVLCALLCASACMAIIVKPTHRQPNGWARAGEPVGSHPIRLQLALKQRNMDVLEKTLMRISDPREATYSQWLGLDDLTQLIAPPMSDVRTVISWLESHG